MEGQGQAARVLIAGGGVRERRQLAVVIAALPGIARVHEADDAAAALIGAERADLVLLDVDLPAPGALETISVLRERHADLPVIAVSAANEPETTTALLDAGALSFLLRDTKPAQVRSIVLGALEGHGVLDRDVVRPVLDG